MENKVRVRFAPSPTGFVHIGSLRTALYNYLFARKNGGDYILRIEDTDQSRLVSGALLNMLKIFEWAKIENDEGVVLVEGEISQKGEFGPYIQSERLDIYSEYIDQLLENGSAYYCFCSKERIEKMKEEQISKGENSKYDGHCRSIPLKEARARVAANEPHVIRLKLPADKDISFEDIVRGKVTVNTNDLDDQVLFKTDGYPTYHFAVVVDDHLMGITHVIRGEEWVISTPKHVFLYEAFGWEAPKFVHLPNILNSQRKKLSKRQDDVSVSDFKDKGYLPEGLINYLALVGWSPNSEKEIFSMEELFEAFNLDRISKSGGIFDVDKLNYINSHYMKTENIDHLTDMAIPYLMEAGYIQDEDLDNADKILWIKGIVTLLRDRLPHMSEITKEAGVFFNTNYQLSNDEAVEFMKKEQLPLLLDLFEKKLSEIDSIDEEFGKRAFKEIQTETGFKGKELYMPLRTALMGEVHGPDMGLTLMVLGKKNVQERIKYARTLI
ncbi:MAG: glutamate--tRNA ligase [Eubacteriales bacterium]